MDIKNYDELLRVAKLCESDIDKLKVLQDYFLENVSFNYLQEFAMAISSDSYNLSNFENGKKIDFISKEDKENVLSEFEKFFGNNFKFSTKDRETLLLALGKVEPATKKITQLFGKTYTINIPGYDGSLFDCIRKIAKVDSEVFENGLIKYGVCRNFASFVKKFCSDLGIKCYYIETNDNHVFNIMEIDEEKKIFDYTRMIGIRDDFHNFNGQEINDWFNMSFEKMFKYKPNREITKVDGKKLYNQPISKENYSTYFSNIKNFEYEDFER